MQSASFPAHPARAHYRHELRTLTYVTLDTANGGILRNLSHEGVAVQAVAALHQQQRVRLRFELRFPRLRVEAYGRVNWANSSGQCGIQFLDLPEATRHQINEWIFSNFLDTVAREAENPRSIFGSALNSNASGTGSETKDGLTVSDSPCPVIRLEESPVKRDDAPVSSVGPKDMEALVTTPGRMNRLLGSLSGRTLAWLVDSLIVIAALCLFVVIFLSIAHELPQWQLTLSAGVAAAVFVGAAYWTIFVLYGRLSLGARLAQIEAARLKKEECAADRFR